MIQRWLLLAALATPLSIHAQTDAGGGTAPAQPGGTYTGPGDTVPAGPSNPGGPTTGGPHNPGPGDTTGSGTSGGLPGAPAVGGLNPGVIPPGATQPEPPVTPSSRPRVDNPQSWQLWWHYNRWDHLDAGSLDRFATSGTGNFFLGRGEKRQAPPLLKASTVQMRDLVEPALLEVLQARNSSDLDIHAIHALSKLRHDFAKEDDDAADFASVLAGCLQNGNLEVAEKSVLAMGIRGEARFLGPLVSILLEHPDANELLGRSRPNYRLRIYSAYALGLLAERNDDPSLRAKVYHALARCLRTERSEIQAACLLAIGLCPLPMESLAASSDEVRALGSNRIEQVLDVLAFFEDVDQDTQARSQAPNALARLVRDDAPESLRSRVLLGLLAAVGPHTRAPKEVQNGAVIALGRIGRSGDDPIDREVREELERLAYRSSANRQTRYFAMVALGEAASRPGSGEQAFEGLEFARKVLLRQMARSRGQALAWTCLALGLLEEGAADRGEVPPAEVAEALRFTLRKNRSAEVAGAAALALGLLRDQESEPILVERMIDAGEMYLKGYLALSLGMIRAASSIDPLITALEGSINQPFVLNSCAIALSMLGEQEVGARLVDLFDEASNPETQAAIGSAMGWIKDPRPLTPLCQRLRNTKTADRSRAWMAVAIGRVCDEDSWPWVGRMSVGINYDVDLPTLLEYEYENGLLDLP